MTSMHPKKNLLVLVAVLVLFQLAACSSSPPKPDWQLNAKAATERFVAAMMAGNQRLEVFEFERAKTEISSTGKMELLGRLELLRCAVETASLVFQPCAGFERLRADAMPAERAYADYLAGTLQAQDAQWLPDAQRAIALGGQGVANLEGMDYPLSQLVAAGVLLRTHRASPTVLAQAVNTASAQGWRRPLLAWLGVQALWAEQGGDAQEAARLRRRMAAVQGVQTNE